MVRNLFIMVFALPAVLFFNPADVRAEEDSKHYLGLQGGWHSVELDYESPVGVFADVGVPYVFWFYEDSGFVPLHFRGGYAFRNKSNLQIRLGLRLDAIFVFADHLYSMSGEDGTAPPFFWILMPEIEFRYDFDCRLSLGLVLPVLVFGGAHLDNGSDSLFWYLGWPATQVYIGYRWAL